MGGFLLGRASVKRNLEKPMKTLVSIFALSMALAFATPAAAGTGPNSAPPTMKSSCEKAKMKWDDTAHKCCAATTSSGKCM